MTNKLQTVLEINALISYRKEKISGYMITFRPGTVNIDSGICSIYLHEATHSADYSYSFSPDFKAWKQIADKAFEGRDYYVYSKSSKSIIKKISDYFVYFDDSGLYPDYGLVQPYGGYAPWEDIATMVTDISLFDNEFINLLKTHKYKQVYKEKFDYLCSNGYLKNKLCQCIRDKAGIS